MVLMRWTRSQKYLRLLALLTHFLCIFAKATVDTYVVPRIIGGNRKGIDEFPCIVSIQNDPYCTGTIIHSMWILTAAKCANKPNLTIRVGSVNRDKNGTIYEVESATVHPEYQEGIQENGIALLKLKKALELTKSVKPIQLPDADEGRITTGQYCAAGAFGRNIKKPDSLPNTLKVAEVVTITRKICQALVNVSMENSFVCVQGLLSTAAGPCTGIGSPLVCRCQQVGIFLGLEGECGDLYVPPYYLLINKYREWIRSVSNV